MSTAWLVGVSLFGAAGPPPNQMTAPDWSRVVTVDERHPVGPLLQHVFHQLAPIGMGGNATAHLLHRVGKYLDAGVAEQGHACLSIGLLLDSASASKVARWSPDDTSRLVIALQRDFHGQNHDAGRSRRVIERMRQGGTAAQLLGEGETLTIASLER